MAGSLSLHPASASSAVMTSTGRAQEDVAPFLYLRFTAVTSTLCSRVLGECGVIHGDGFTYRALRKLLWSLRFFPWVQSVVALVTHVFEARTSFVNRIPDFCFSGCSNSWKSNHLSKRGPHGSPYSLILKLDEVICLRIIPQCHLTRKQKQNNKISWKASDIKHLQVHRATNK